MALRQDPAVVWSILEARLLKAAKDHMNSKRPMAEMPESQARLWVEMTKLFED